MSEAIWLYSMFQLSSSRLVASQEMNSFSGVAPVVLGALVAPEEAAVELLPPQAVIVSAMAPAISAASNLFFMGNPSLFKFYFSQNFCTSVTSSF